MSGIATAIIGGAVIGGGLNYLGSSNVADAQTSAADTQAAAANYAANLQNQQYQQSFNALAPWRTAGTAAVNQLSSGTQPGGQFSGTFDASKFNLYQDPSYEWIKQQGLSALSAQGAAQGRTGSGNMGTALTDYATQLAGTEWGDAYSRYMQQQQQAYNMLAGISGTGQVATTNTANLGANAANMQGQYATQGANALASGQVGSANALAGGFQGVGNSVNSGVGQYLNYTQNQAIIKALTGGTQSYGDFGTGLTGANNAWAYQPNDMGSYNSMDAGSWGSYYG
jgi:hypothetical protein